MKFLKKKGYEVIWIGRNDLLYKNAAKKSVTKYVSSVKLMLKALFPVIPHKFRLLRALKKKSWDIVMKIIGPFFKINPFSKEDRFYKSFYYGKETKQQADLGLDQLITDEALKFLEKYRKSKRKKPFCLYLPFAYPHPPYKVEEPFFSMYKRDEIPSVFPPETEGIIYYDDKPEFMKVIRDLYKLDKLGDKDFREIRAVYYGRISKVENDNRQIV